MKKITRVGWVAKNYDKDLCTEIDDGVNQYWMLPLLFVRSPKTNGWSKEEKPARKVRITVEEIDA